MTLEEALYSFLKDNAAVSALVSTHIHWNKATQGTAYPFIVMYHDNLQPIRSHGGKIGWESNVQLHVFSQSYASGKAVCDAVVSALDEFNGVMGTVNVERALLDNLTSFIDEDTEDHHFVQEWTIVHT